MLSDHERETLQEIQRQLLVEDPGFARSFEVAEQRSPHDRRRRACTVSAVVALVLSLLMLVAGLLGTALVLAAGAALLAVARHLWDESEQSEARDRGTAD